MMSTGGQPSRARIRLSASRPSMPGMRTSMTTHCGILSRMRFRASSAEAAVRVS